MEMTFGDRLAALAGVGGVVSTYGFVALAAHSAVPEDPPSQIAAALIENEDRAHLAAQLGLAAAFLLMIFVARLHGALTRSDRSRWFPTVALLGGAAIVAALLFETVVVIAQTSTGAFTESPEVAQVLVLLSWNSAALYAPGFLALLIGATATCFQAEVMPSAVKWLGIVLLAVMAPIVLLLQAPGLSTAPGSVWVIAVSLTLAIWEPPEPNTVPT